MIQEVVIPDITAVIIDRNDDLIALIIEIITAVIILIVMADCPVTPFIINVIALFIRPVFQFRLHFIPRAGSGDGDGGSVVRIEAFLPVVHQYPDALVIVDETHRKKAAEEDSAVPHADFHRFRVIGERILDDFRHLFNDLAVDFRKPRSQKMRLLLVIEAGDERDPCKHAHVIAGEIAYTAVGE